jgi:uncharacterized protein (TIGR00251 family)
MRIKLKVKPNSIKEEIIKINEDEYMVYLKSPPKEGKANLELLKLLKRYFKKPVKIVFGFNSRNKVIEILD